MLARAFLPSRAAPNFGQAHAFDIETSRTREVTRVLLDAGEPLNLDRHESGLPLHDPDRIFAPFEAPGGGDQSSLVALARPACAGPSRLIVAGCPPRSAGTPTATRTGEGRPLAWSSPEEWAHAPS